MRITIGKWCFCPGLLTSLLALMFICLFISLGFWQLDRADYKRNLYKDFQDKMNSNPIDLNLIIEDEDYQEHVWQPVYSVGGFNEDTQVLLDNQVMKGDAGYFVYTPFEIESAIETWVLVNRGWVSAGNDRNLTPQLEYQEGVISISGVVKEAPKTGLVLKETEPEEIAKGIYRVQNIDVDVLGQLLGKSFLPFIIRMENSPNSLYARDWHVPGSGEEVHNGYAFQWFAFAAVLFVIYILLNFKK